MPAGRLCGGGDCHHGSMLDKQTQRYTVLDLPCDVPASSHNQGSHSCLQVDFVVVVTAIMEVILSLFGLGGLGLLKILRVLRALRILTRSAGMRQVRIPQHAVCLIGLGASALPAPSAYVLSSSS